MCHKYPCEFPTKPSKISPEFINLIVSLLILVIRLPSPFWYTNKAFSIVFSLFAFVSAACISMEYESLILIIKIIHNPKITKEYLDAYIPGWVILIIFFFKSILMLFMLIIVFEYGYTQYLSNMRKYRQYFSSDISDSVSQQSLNNNQIKWYHVAPRLLGTIVLIFLKALKIPILYAQIWYLKSCTKVSSHPTVLVGISISLFYFLSCIFLWFGLCVKNKWQFHINIQTNPIPNIGPGKLTGSPEPIYGCFYNAPSGSSQTSFSKPMLRSIEGSDISSNRVAQSGNYVYMHPGMNPAMHAIPIHEHLEFNAGDSEASFESNTKSYDSNDIRYKRHPYATIHNMENSQYATLASLQSGVLLPAKAMSDTSSNEIYSKNQSRRGSNRVTFKEDNNLNYSIVYPCNFSNNTPVGRVPDILSMNNSDSLENPKLSCSPHGFDPDLEMSTDMRQSENAGGRDPRLCSQV